MKQAEQDTRHQDIQIAQIQWKLKTKIVGKSPKIDFMLSGYLQSAKILDYHARMTQQQISQQLNIQHCENMSKIVQYIHTYQNLSFDTYSNQLSLSFKNGDTPQVLQIAMRVQIWDTVIKLAKQNIALKSGLDQCRKKMEQRDKKWQQKIKEKMKKMEKYCEQVQEMGKNVKNLNGRVDELQKNFETHLGMDPEEWKYLGCPNHPKQMNELVAKFINPMYNDNAAPPLPPPPIDTECMGMKYFKIEGNRITYTDIDCKNTQLLGRIPISSKNSFSFRIVKSALRGMGIGVVDAKQKTIRRTDWMHPNIIFYGGLSSLRGNGCQLIQKIGKGYGEGSIVVVNVCLQQGKIQWIVDGISQAKYQMGKLKDKQICWVPYIVLYSHGDIVEWLE